MNKNPTPSGGSGFGGKYSCTLLGESVSTDKLSDLHKRAREVVYERGDPRKSPYHITVNVVGSSPISIVIVTPLTRRRRSVCYSTR